jgi:hypothetical protein
MNKRRPVSAKILVGAEGLGTPDQDLLEKRAWEVAAIQGHEIPTVADWDEARRELHGRCADNELAAVVEDGEGGMELIGVSMGNGEGDETNLGEELVREGMEEAEHERMLLANKPRPEGIEL